jgi:hypothetical protein
MCAARHMQSVFCRWKFVIPDPDQGTDFEARVKDFGR